jgi:hypothetical protein
MLCPSRLLSALGRVPGNVESACCAFSPGMSRLSRRGMGQARAGSLGPSGPSALEDPYEAGEGGADHRDFAACNADQGSRRTTRPCEVVAPSVAPPPFRPHLHFGAPPTSPGTLPLPDEATGAARATASGQVRPDGAKADADRQTLSGQRRRVRRLRATPPGHRLAQGLTPPPAAPSQAPFSRSLSRSLS